MWLQQIQAGNSALQPLAQEPRPQARSPTSEFLGKASRGSPSSDSHGGTRSLQFPPVPQQPNSRAVMATGNHKPWTEPEVGRKIKIHSHGKSNDNRTTEAEIKTISALHGACGFVCVLSTCQLIRSCHMQVTVGLLSLLCKTRGLERSILAKNFNKCGEGNTKQLSTYYY